MRPWKSRTGQIVIPAMLLFPTLFLFVYLIYETAKLSREKIKHQFAMDAAAFVEATNYSDFLNRTAYVNGAFPMRIFDEGFKTTMIDCDQLDGCSGPKSLWEIMCKNGDFPMAGGTCDPGAKNEYKSEKSWDIAFGGLTGMGKNFGDPPDVGGTLEILTMNDKIKDFVISKAASHEIKKAAIEGGMKTLREDGMEKAIAGKTTVDEVLRVTQLD